MEILRPRESEPIIWRSKESSGCPSTPSRSWPYRSLFESFQQIRCHDVDLMCTYLYMYIHTYTHTMYIRIYSYIYICTRNNTYTDIHIYIYIYVHMHIYREREREVTCGSGRVQLPPMYFRPAAAPFRIVMKRFASASEVGSTLPKLLGGTTGPLRAPLEGSLQGDIGPCKAYSRQYLLLLGAFM